MEIGIPIYDMPLSGSMLLASPSLQDGVFDNSVIYLAEHSKEEGAEGCILNRPTGESVGNVLCASEFDELKNLPIFYGGPVDSDHISFSSFHWKEGKLVGKICISAEQAVKALNKSGHFVKAFVGRSSWDKGQLEEEMENLAWMPAPPIKEILTMPQDETLWKNTLQLLSPFHHIISLTPENPFLN